MSAGSGLNEVTVQALLVAPSSLGTLYAGTTVGVYKSTDGGNHWTAIWCWGQVRALAIDPSTPVSIYAGTENGVFKSANGGTDWVSLPGFQTVMFFHWQLGIFT